MCLDSLAADQAIDLNQEPTMTISGISSINSAPLHRPSAIHQDWQALEKALKSGDLSGAQSAFATLQSDMQKTQQASGAQPSAQSNPMSLVEQAMQNIGKALASGDLSGAQKAFAAFKQQMQAFRQRQTSAATTTSSNAGGSLIHQDWQALEKALNSGDLSGAQSAFATLQSDLQNTQQASSTQQSAQTTLKSLIEQAMQNIGKALASGDLSGAQKALAAFKQQMQASRQSGTSAAPDVDPGAVSSTGQDTLSLGSGINVSA